jgi:spore coat protein H
MLPEYSIWIGNREWTKLNERIWSGSFTNAHLEYGGKRVPIRIRYRGGHTRNYPKKSYELRVGSRTYHFNAEYDDPSMIRNALSFRFFESIGVPSPATRHCILRINGRSQGVYLLIESVNRAFFRRRRIAARSLVYAENDSANFALASPVTGKRKRSLFEGYKLVIGRQADRERLKTFVRRLHRLRGKRLNRWLGRRLDMNNYLRWLAGAVLTGNADGFDQNYALYEHRKTARYRIVPWDYEGSWGRNCYGRLVDADLVRITGENALTDAVLSDPGARERYRKLLEQLLEAEFTEARIMPVVSEFYERIAPDIYTDTTRKWPPDVFDGEPEVIRRYIRDRRETIRSEMDVLKS